MPGPPPKDVSLRPHKGPRSDTLASAKRVLPAAGRLEPSPAWPAGLDEPDGAAELWDDLWSLPQAVAWFEMCSFRLVARYVCQLLLAEQADTAISRLAEVRQMEDRLGLSPMSMLRLRWTVAADESATQAKGSGGTGNGNVVTLADYQHLYE